MRGMSKDDFESYKPKKSTYDLSGLSPDKWKTEDEFKPDEKQKKDEGAAGIWDFIGDIAPVAGGVLGGIGGGLLAIPGGPAGIVAGATGGAKLGYDLGNAGKAAAEGIADSERKPAEEEAQQTDLRRQEQDQRRHDLMQMLMSAR